MSPAPKNEEEKQALIRKLRDKLSTKQTDDTEYWKSDLYLYKWLEDKNFAVDKSSKALRKHLKWRKENNMDTILEEDMEDLHKNFVYFMDGVDKDGRTIVSIPCNQCNLKEVVESGNRDRLTRFLRQMVERQADRIRKTCDKDPTAPSTFVAIADFEGVGGGDGEVTPQVISLLMSAANSCEDNYPGVLDRIYVINASKSIKKVFTMVRPVLRKATSKIIHIFSDKRHKWEPAILVGISAEQIRPRFGGTMEDASLERNGNTMSSQLEMDLSHLILSQ